MKEKWWNIHIKMWVGFVTSFGGLRSCMRLTDRYYNIWRKHINFQVLFFIMASVYLYILLYIEKWILKNGSPTLVLQHRECNKIHEYIFLLTPRSSKSQPNTPELVMESRKSWMTLPNVINFFLFLFRCVLNLEKKQKKNTIGFKKSIIISLPVISTCIL